jgi:hypothetical protein
MYGYDFYVPSTTGFQLLIWYNRLILIYNMQLTFINIDQNYLKKLHDACSEVYYKPSGYENKPYIGCV